MSEKNCSISNLFKNIKYKISGVVLDEIVELLKNGGAEGVSYLSDYVTHCIIGDEPSEIDIFDANDLYEVPAITSDWVILSAKCGKQLPIKGFRYEGCIFSGVVACISQLSAADARAIWAMIKYHGGKCSLKLASNTTHLVVGKATGAKYDRVLNSTKENFCINIYPVTPDWVLDSIRNGSRCLENLYHPRLLIEKQSSPSENFSTAYIAGFFNIEVPPEENTAAPNVSNELLEELKQRLPWNRPTSTASSSVTSNSQPTPNSKYQSTPASAILQVTSNQVATGQPKLFQQQQALLQHLPKELAPPLPQPLPQEQLQKQRKPQPPQQQRVLVPQQFLQQAVPTQWTPPHTFACQFQQTQPQQQQHQLQQHQVLQQRVQQQVKPQLLLSQQVKTHPQQLILQNSQAHQQYVNTTSVTTPCQHTLQNTQPQTQEQTKPFRHARQEAQRKQALKLKKIHQSMTRTQSRPGPTRKRGSCGQLIHMDAQSYAHLLRMDPQQRALFYQGLRKQRQLVLQRQSQAEQQQIQTTQFGQAGSVAASGSCMAYEVQPSQLNAVKSATATPLTGLAQTFAQFYGHNPNLKLSPGMCLLGCIFLIVEYDRNGFDVHTWQRVIIKNGGDVEASYSSRVTHILCQTQKHPLVQQGLRDCKRCITADWLSDVILKQQVLPPWLALHLPTPFSDEKPCRNLIISYSGFKGEERILVKKMIETIGAKITSYFSSHHDILVCRWPDGKKYRKAQEWGKSVVNVQWLNEILLGHYSCLLEVDSHKYQQFNLINPFKIDYTLVPHLMAAWKLPINITQESYDRVKSRPPLTDRRKHLHLSNSSVVIPDPDQENKELGFDIQVTNPNPPLPNRRPYIMFSRVENIAEKQRKVWQLGGVVARNCFEATHLLMSKPQRTFKLLCCLSTCKYIVSLNWLLDSHDQNTFLDEANYTFSDSEVERTYNFSISDVLKNTERRELFKGKTFYLSPGVFPSPLALREIILCAGGSVDRQRKSLRQIQEAEPYTYLIVTVTDDLHLVADVLHANIGVYNTEFVMSAVMKQKIDYDFALKRSHFINNNELFC